MSFERIFRSEKEKSKRCARLPTFNLRRAAQLQFKIKIKHGLFGQVKFCKLDFFFRPKEIQRMAFYLRQFASKLPLGRLLRT